MQAAGKKCSVSSIPDLPAAGAPKRNTKVFEIRLRARKNTGDPASGATWSEIGEFMEWAPKDRLEDERGRSAYVTSERLSTGRAMFLAGGELTLVTT